MSLLIGGDEGNGDRYVYGVWMDKKKDLGCYSIRGSPNDKTLDMSSDQFLELFTDVHQVLLLTGHMQEFKIVHLGLRDEPSLDG